MTGIFVVESGKLSIVEGHKEVTYVVVCFVTGVWEFD